MSTRTETPTTRPAVDGVNGARILIVESRYYADIADALISGAEREISKNGALSERVVVPGAFEIPGAIALAAGRYDGFVALGCVIRGETASPWWRSAVAGGTHERPAEARRHAKPSSGRAAGGGAGPLPMAGG